MTTNTIAFIGGGNMASSIIGGLRASGWSANHIRVSDPSSNQRQKLKSDFQVQCFESNTDCIRDAEIIVLATKPQMLKEALKPISEPLSLTKPLVTSIAAGITGTDILKWIGSPLPLIRVMPNTPALVNRGVSAMFANQLCSDEHKKAADQIMGAVGKTVWVSSESDIDTVTGISGSGPAYFFKLMEIMIENAVRNGLTEEDAKILVIETAAGAAKLAGNSEQTPAILRKQVTSPAGTTEAALISMESSGIDQVVSSGIDAAIERSRELAIMLGEH